MLLSGLGEIRIFTLSSGLQPFGVGGRPGGGNLEGEEKPKEKRAFVSARPQRGRWEPGEEALGWGLEACP